MHPAALLVALDPLHRLEIESVDRSDLVAGIVESSHQPQRFSFCSLMHDDTEMIVALSWRGGGRRRDDPFFVFVFPDRDRREFKRIRSTSANDETAVHDVDGVLGTS